ncbi:TPA: hypothetical protein ACN7D8_004516 [Klebsiella pneumoniae]|nr:hypothetical protein [Klebsiella quasipneumoniae]HBT6127758.1 hypothetical protein [Klebsiella quasipneumoniae]HBT6223828.1 hypothetical protein [Klebsiella quasipneumoniae]HBT6246512.1 hypothetical protein [Klebsiella quasipneumoniae]
MSNLPEQVSWESGIHQLEEADRAKAGPGGVLNIQANQLANRTRWLRALVESAQDYREYTFYKSESDPDGTIAGNANTPAGKIFRVAQGLSDEFAFIYYLNDSGTATPITALLGRGAIINNVREYSALMLAENDVAAGNILEGSKCWVTDLTHETLAVEYVNSSGTLEPTGRKMPSQEAVDALARHFDGSNPDLLIGFKDALNKVFASWNLAGQYVGDLEYAQWDENGRMYADLALLGDIKIVKTYQNPDVAFYILDANGRVMLEIPLVESESDSDEKIQEIETRLDVATRTDGLLKSEFFGLNFLSETRRALMMAEAKEGQLIINIIGNSWVHNEWNLPRRLTQVLQDRFGDAGAGFAGYNRNFAHPGRAFLIVQSGTWTEETVTTPTGTNFGPAGSQGVTSTAGASMAFQSLTGDTSAAIYHNADSSVSPVIKIKYRDNVSGTSTEETQLTLTGTGVTRTELPAPPVTGNWTATLTLVSGTLAFCGIELKKSTPGVRVNKLGTGGSTWRQWTTLNRAGWVQGITPMAANLNILLESVNGAYSYDADAEAGYTTEMAGRVRSASAFSDVLIISPPQTLGTPTYSLRDFAYKLRGIAGSLKAAHIDLQPVFGQSLSDYNDSGKKYIVAADVNHPTYPAGQCVITETVLRAILSAF